MPNPRLERRGCGRPRWGTVVDPDLEGRTPRATCEPIGLPRSTWPPRPCAHAFNARTSSTCSRTRKDRYTPRAHDRTGPRPREDRVGPPRLQHEACRLPHRASGGDLTKTRGAPPPNSKAQPARALPSDIGPFFPDAAGQRGVKLISKLRQQRAYHRVRHFLGSCRST